MTEQKQTSSDTTTISTSDLQRLSEFASIVAATQDALTDDMISRLASAFSEGMVLLDRVTRNDGLIRLLQVLDHPENQALLMGLSDALTKTSRDISIAPPAKGGLGGLLKMVSEPSTQEGLRIMSIIGEHLSESMRELHRRGG
jgi:hypothetical protein